MFRLSANDLEGRIIQQLNTAIEQQVAHAIHNGELSGDRIELLQAIRDDSIEILAKPHSSDARSLVRKFVQHVEVETDAIQMRIDLASLDEALATDTELQHTVPIASVRVGKQLKLAIPPGEEKNPTHKDPALIKLVVQAQTLRDRMTTVSASTFDALASQLGYSREHTADLLRISYLAPDILTGILEGRQPENLSRRALMKMPRLPHDWSQQRQMLGFG